MQSARAALGGEIRRAIVALLITPAVSVPLAGVPRGQPDRNTLTASMAARVGFSSHSASPSLPNEVGEPLGRGRLQADHEQRWNEVRSGA
jgi:hypothetical protein